jgi:hypothetical protein
MGQRGYALQGRRTRGLIAYFRFLLFKSRELGDLPVSDKCLKQVLVYILGNLLIILECWSGTKGSLRTSYIPLLDCMLYLPGIKGERMVYCRLLLISLSFLSFDSEFVPLHPHFNFLLVFLLSFRVLIQI